MFSKIVEKLKDIEIFSLAVVSEVLMKLFRSDSVDLIRIESDLVVSLDGLIILELLEYFLLIFLRVRSLNLGYEKLKLNKCSHL
jgi:hypothetical protein